MSVMARALRALIHSYQVVRAGRPSPCRFIPSCSAYAAEAIESHGAGRGSWLAVKRVCRCHPWGGHGWDPVPEANKANLGVSGAPNPSYHLTERTVA